MTRYDDLVRYNNNCIIILPPDNVVQINCSLLHYRSSHLYIVGIHIILYYNNIITFVHRICVFVGHELSSKYHEMHYYYFFNHCQYYCFVKKNLVLRIAILILKVVQIIYYIQNRTCNFTIYISIFTKSRLYTSSYIL